MILHAFFERHEALKANVHGLGVSPIVGLAMTVGAESNHEPRVIRAAIGQAPDMMCLKIDSAVGPMEGDAAAILALTFGARENVVADDLAALDCCALALGPFRVRIRGLHGFLAKFREIVCRGLEAQLSDGILDRLKWAKVEDDRLPHITLRVGGGLDMVALAYVVTEKPQALASHPKGKKVSPVHRMVSDRPVAFDEAHVTDLAFTEILKNAIIADAISVAMSFAFLAGNDDDREAIAGRRDDAASLLPLEACVNVCPPIVSATFFKSPRHSSVLIGSKYDGYREPEEDCHNQGEYSLNPPPVFELVAWGGSRA